MTTLVKQFEKQIQIPEDHRLTIDLPIDIPSGDVRVTMTFEYKKRVNRAGELRGMAKGKIKMADDFDAPMEDFKDYM